MDGANKMTKEELIELLEKSDDKYAILTSYETFAKCTFPEEEFLDLMKQYLTNEQKVELFKSLFFAKRVAEIQHPEDHRITFREYRNSVRESISLLASVDDTKMMMDVLTDESLEKTLFSGEMGAIFDCLSDEEKERIFRNQAIMQSGRFDVVSLLKHISEEKRKDLLLESSYLLEKLKVRLFSLVPMVQNIQGDEFINSFLERYTLDSYQISELLMQYSTEKKKDVLLSNSFELSSSEKTKLLSSFEVDALISFLNEHPDFIESSSMKEFLITSTFEQEKAKEFFSKIESLKLDDTKKKMMIAAIPEEVKSKLNREMLPSELQGAFDLILKRNMESAFIPSYFLQVDLTGDLEKYKGLDEYLFINGEKVLSEEREKLLELR